MIATAAAVVVRGDRREIIRSQELVEIDADDDLKRRPRLEQAFTGALRAVSSSDHPQGVLHDRARRDPERPSPRAPDPERLRGGRAWSPPAPASRPRSATARCSSSPAPASRCPPTTLPASTAYLDSGGTALVAVGPQPDSGDRGFLDLGLGELLGGFGARARRATSSSSRIPRLRSPRGRGETFAPSLRPHPVTQGLMRLAEKGVAPVLTVASSLSATGAGTAAVVPLLVTSDQAFGMVDFFAWAKTGAPPIPGPADKKGPLTVAYAAERFSKDGTKEGKLQGRLVVVGSAGALEGANWQTEELRGTALFVESAVAWLTARPPILDIPQKPAFTAGLRVSDEWLAQTFRYVALYMPLASMLLGIAVYLRRRGEKRGDGKPTAGKTS